MTQESENKLARRVDDKRAEVPLQWNEATNAAPEASATAASQQPTQREVPEFTGLEAMARVFADAADANGKVVLSAQSCDLLYRAMTTPIVGPEVAGRCRAKGRITSLEGLTRYTLDSDRMIVDKPDGGFVFYADVERLLATNEELLAECRRDRDALRANLAESRLLATTAGEQAEPAQATGGTSEQQARYAIDGAIQYGRENRNPPPSTDHWLYEYWNIGQQLRELGKTGWDNLTPIAASPAPAAQAVDAPSAADDNKYDLQHARLAKIAANPAPVAAHAEDVPAGWDVYRDDSPGEQRFVVSDGRSWRSFSEDEEPTLFRYFNDIAGPSAAPGKADAANAGGLVGLLRRARAELTHYVGCHADKVHTHGVCSCYAGPLMDEIDAALLDRSFATSATDAKDAEQKPLAHGHREDWYLMANARRVAEKPIHVIRSMPNWVLASELFATGSTAAHQICRDAGIDPDGREVQRAAIAASQKRTEA